MIFLNNFRSDENGANAVAAENLSGLYEVYIPDEKGDYSYHGPYADGGKYPDGAIAIPVESTVERIENFKADQEFANVIGSSRDKRHEGTSWIDVYNRRVNPIFGTSCCTDGRFYGWHGAPPACEGRNHVLGGHIIKGTAARQVGVDGQGVYILPICHKHNTSSCGGGTGTGFYMKTSRIIPALKLTNYLRGERVRAAIAEAAENGKTDG